jgi:hypothetical protein
MRIVKLKSLLLFLAPHLSNATTCEKSLPSLDPFLESTDTKQLLPKQYLEQPSDPKVFHDPPDTATFISAIQVLTNKDSTVLNLGTGSGADSFQVAGSAEFVLGVDTSDAAIKSASTNYKRDNLAFHQFDYFTQGPAELQKIWPYKKPPSVLASNPPYVPCVSAAACPSPTMYGGPDGIRFIREVINYGKTLKIPKLALTIGSYSSPKEVMRYLKDNKYSAVHFSLTPVPFGEYSKANLPHLLELEKEGRAILWRPKGSNEPFGYFIVGISSIDTTQVNYSGLILSESSLLEILNGLSTLNLNNIFNKQRTTRNLPIRLIRSN